jgi:methionyl-tRNA formyltransferase
VHASLLPRWRGASPIQHALLAGDAQTGVCLMRMEAGLDTGPVFVCEATPIAGTDTAVSLHDRLATIGAALLRQHLDHILGGRLPAKPQDEALSTYAPMIKKEDGLLDWQQSSERLDRRIRAMTPWPGAYTTWQGQVLKILRATPVTGRVPDGVPGQVTTINGNVIVLSATGGIQLHEVQLAGKKGLPVAEFLHGHPQFVGSRLGV